MGGYTETIPNPADDPPRVTIEMANVGGVGAAKAELRVTFTTFDTGHPIPWWIQEELARATPQVMNVSHAGSFVLVVVFTPATNVFADQGLLTGRSVYCVGYVEYSDETGELKGRTGFIRRCDIRQGWFLPADFPGVGDFEYAD